MTKEKTSGTKLKPVSIAPTERPFIFDQERKAYYTLPIFAQSDCLTAQQLNQKSATIEVKRAILFRINQKLNKLVGEERVYLRSKLEPAVSDVQAAELWQTKFKNKVLFENRSEIPKNDFTKYYQGLSYPKWTPEEPQPVILPPESTPKKKRKHKTSYPPEIVPVHTHTLFYDKDKTAYYFNVPQNKTNFIVTIKANIARLKLSTSMFANKQDDRIYLHSYSEENGSDISAAKLWQEKTGNVLTPPPENIMPQPLASSSQSELPRQAQNGVTSANTHVTGPTNLAPPYFAVHPISVPPATTQPPQIDARTLLFGTVSPPPVETSSSHTPAAPNIIHSSSLPPEPESDLMRGGQIEQYDIFEDYWLGSTDQTLTSPTDAYNGLHYHTPPTSWVEAIQGPPAKKQKIEGTHVQTLNRGGNSSEDVDRFFL